MEVGALKENVRSSSRGPLFGWLFVALLFVAFLVGLARRRGLEKGGQPVIRMLFVPSVEQGTLATRGNELAAFLAKDAGLVVKTQVPTSYAAVIQALGAGQADIAWVPAFAYVIAHARYGAEAKLQVIREVERYAVVVTRTGEAEPDALRELAGQPVAISRVLLPDLRKSIVAELDRWAPGWKEVPVESDKAGVARLLDEPGSVVAAVSAHVFSGPYDLVGDGRKELAGERFGTLEATRQIFKTDTPVKDRVAAYYGGLYTRVDSGITSLAALDGKTFSFSDPTSTSGYIFPLALLQKRGIKPSQILFAGGHPNSVQAVEDGKVAAGAAFYSPPGKVNEVERTFVADARHILMKRLPEEQRLAYLDQVRVLAITDPVPNDVCCVRPGFPKAVWERFEASLQRFIATPEGLRAYLDLVAAVAAKPCEDSVFDGFRATLKTTGVDVQKVLEAEEEKIRKRREKAEAEKKAPPAKDAAK